MADQVVTSGIDTLLAQENVRTRVAELRREAAFAIDVLTDVVTDIPDEFDYNSLIGTIYTSINGAADIPEQRVQVMYLARDQLLLLPQALGVNPTDQALSEATHSAVIAVDYWKATALSYSAIYDLVNSAGTITEKRTLYGDYAIPAPRLPAPLWTTDNYYRRGAGVVDPDQTVDFVFGVLSRILKLNCDIRDVGALVGMTDFMRVEDSDWGDHRSMFPGRLVVKLKPYTMNCIAALNMPPCQNWPLGAWVRAFGVGCGVLPSRQTRLNKEWKYTNAMPTQPNVNLVVNLQSTLGTKLIALAMNLLAMFGLLHLNKNHTYITGDPNMERICTSFIQTLRTMVDTAVIDDIKAKMEVGCRTAAHPFGLGQTYWLALVMGGLKFLAAPLALRVDVAPPLAQRLLIVDAAVKEWNVMPVGQLLTSMFQRQVALIREEIKKVKARPPAYSELAEIYGEPRMKTVSKSVRTFADALMPIIAGYAQALHTDNEKRKDGLALAMSFMNVERDAKAATQTYTALWEKYIDGVDKGGLEAFVKNAMDMGQIDVSELVEEEEEEV